MSKSTSNFEPLLGSALGACPKAAQTPASAAAQRPRNNEKVQALVKDGSVTQVESQTIHVWNSYLHWCLKWGTVWYGKCMQLFHTWMVWEWTCQKRRRTTHPPKILET